MVINNPEWLELTKDIESFMSVNGLGMANQQNAPTINTQQAGCNGGGGGGGGGGGVNTGVLGGGGIIVNDWTQSLTNTSPSSKVQTVTPANTTNHACAILTSRPNSHPFQTRTLVLEVNQQVKVGRSLARNRVSENNAIFDCKVLSRNHAVIYYSDGKFFIKDTGSSNGTFINNQRLSQGCVQSDPFEVCSNDIVQFGVDVMENSRKETHGCIVATLKLYLPDGRETKASSHSFVGMCPSSIPPEDLCRLNQYIQEAVQREQMLESKLLNLQRIIEITRKNSATNWQAMIDEDRLLSRIDLLENKLQCFQKNTVEDKLREEIIKLHDDKSDYQNSAKEALRRVYQERSEALQKLTTMERALCSSEDECSLLRDQLCKTEQTLQETTARLSQSEENFSVLKEKMAQDKIQDGTETQNLYAQLKEKILECNEMKDRMDVLLKEKEELLSRVTLYQYCENLTNSYVDEEEDDSDTLNRVKKMLSNSDLKDVSMEEDDDSKITNNIRELNNLYVKENLIEDQLNTLKKKLKILQSKTIKTETDEDSIQLISDGNQNVDRPVNDANECNNIIKEVLTLSWLIFMELKARENSLKQNENSISAEMEDKYKTRISELEHKILTKSLTLEEIDDTESEIEESDSESSSTINQNDSIVEKLKLNNNNSNNSISNNNQTDEIILLNIEIKELRGELGKLELIRQQLEIDLVNSRKINENPQNKLKQSDISGGDSGGVLAIQNEQNELVVDHDIEAPHTKDTKNNNNLLNSLNNDTNNVNRLKIQSPTMTSTSTILSTAAVTQEPSEKVIVDSASLVTQQELHLSEDDLVILNDPKVQNEEELIIFKEKCNEMTNENVKLRENIIKLQSNYNHLRNKSIASMLIYLSPIILIIAYLLSSYL